MFQLCGHFRCADGDIRYDLIKHLRYCSGTVRIIIIVYQIFQRICIGINVITCGMSKCIGLIIIRIYGRCSIVGSVCSPGTGNAGCHGIGFTPVCLGIQCHVGQILLAGIVGRITPALIVIQTRNTHTDGIHSSSCCCSSHTIVSVNSRLHVGTCHEGLHTISVIRTSAGAVIIVVGRRPPGIRTGRICRCTIR